MRLSLVGPRAGGVLRVGSIGGPDSLGYSFLVLHMSSPRTKIPSVQPRLKSQTRADPSGLAHATSSKDSRNSDSKNSFREHQDAFATYYRSEALQTSPLLSIGNAQGNRPT